MSNAAYKWGHEAYKLGMSRDELESRFNQYIASLDKVRENVVSLLPTVFDGFEGNNSGLRIASALIAARLEESGGSIGGGL